MLPGQHDITLGILIHSHGEK